MEIFVKILTENSRDGERHVAAISFLTFVALGADGKPSEVPFVSPETAARHDVWRFVNETH